jgi:hypothetical protein
VLSLPIIYPHTCRCTSQKIGSVDFPFHFIILITAPSPNYYPDTSSALIN